MRETLERKAKTSLLREPAPWVEVAGWQELEKGVKADNAKGKRRGTTGDRECCIAVVTIGFLNLCGSPHPQPA